MASRLARRSRSPKAESVQAQETGRAVPEKNAGRGRSNKKIPGLAKLASFSKAWAEGKSQKSGAKITARDYCAEAGADSNLLEIPQNAANRTIQKWKEKYRPNTVLVLRLLLLSLLKAIVAAGGQPRLTEGITSVRRPADRTVTLTRDELDRLLAHAPAWQKCWLAIAAGHGLRAAEALRLCPAHYNPERGTITYRTKGQQENTVPVTDELRGWLQTVADAPNTATPILEILYGAPITYDMLNRHWLKLKRKSGINPLATMHDLRRTLAVSVYMKTLDVIAVQKLLGHKNLHTTAIYLAAFHPESIAPILNELRSKLPKHIQ